MWFVWEEDPKVLRNLTLLIKQGVNVKLGKEEEDIEGEDKEGGDKKGEERLMSKERKDKMKKLLNKRLMSKERKDELKKLKKNLYLNYLKAKYRLTQAAYNRDKPIAQRRNLSYRHLANHIRSVTKKKESFSFRNFSIAKDFIRNDGIHREGVTSGKGATTKMHFESQRHVEAQEVFERLETVPLGIVLEDRPEIHKVRMEIYKVPGNRDERCDEHALLAVAKGRTPDGVDFIVVQNSWGMEYGNNGYCRIFLPDTRDYDIFWPEW
ncbi:Uncharacterized protein HA466_0013540 [Hirschfeldia incana]|nr:Uncharacterized protein HA466_0013540 [Hirschfeldia incana]